MADILAIYVLPLACFGADFAIGGIVVSTYPLSIWVFASSGIAAFALSRHVTAPGSQAIVRSALRTSGIGAVVIGVLLLPLSMMAILLAGLGLLGFIPFFTGYRLIHRAGQMQKGTWTRGIIGALAILLPAFGVLTVEVLGEYRRRQDLLSGDAERVLRAMSQTATYTPSDVLTESRTPMAHMVCSNLDALPLHIPDVEAAAREATGIHGEPLSDDCPAILND